MSSAAGWSAEAGVYLTRVLDRTESCGQTFLTTDGGLHHLLGGHGSLGRARAGQLSDRGREPLRRSGGGEVTITGCLVHAA